MYVGISQTVVMEKKSAVIIKILKIGTPKLFSTIVLKMEWLSVTMHLCMNPKNGYTMSSNVNADQSGAF